MAGPVVFWDFDGTLAHRRGMWSTCLVECLAEVSGGTTAISRDDLRPFLGSGFPWHEHEAGHEHLAPGWSVTVSPSPARGWSSPKPSRRCGGSPRPAGATPS